MSPILLHNERLSIFAISTQQKKRTTQPSPKFRKKIKAKPNLIQVTFRKIIV